MDTSKDQRQKQAISKYAKTEKGKAALQRADEKRREKRREYQRQKQAEYRQKKKEIARMAEDIAELKPAQDVKLSHATVENLDSES